MAANAAPSANAFYEAIRGNPFGTLGKFGLNLGDLVSTDPAPTNVEETPEEPRLRGQLYEAFSRLAEQRQRICASVLASQVQQTSKQAWLKQFEAPTASFSPASLSLSLLLPLLTSPQTLNAEMKTAILRQLDQYCSTIAPCSIPKGSFEGLETIVSLLLGWRGETHDEAIASCLLHLAFALGSPALGATALSLLEDKKLTVGLSAMGLETLATILRRFSLLWLNFLGPAGVVVNCEGAFPSEDLDDLVLPTFQHPAHKHEVRLEPRPSTSWACDVCGFRSSRVLGGQKRYRCAAGCNYDICLRCMSTVAFDVPSSIAAHGSYVYFTSRTGTGIARVGTGLGGTLPGLHSTKKDDSGLRGWVASAGGFLLHHSADADTPHGDSESSESSAAASQAPEEICSVLSSQGSVVRTLSCTPTFKPRAEVETIAFFGQGDSVFQVVLEKGKAGSILPVRVNTFRITRTTTTVSVTIPAAAPDFQLATIAALPDTAYAFEVVSSKNNSLLSGTVITGVLRHGVCLSTPAEALLEIKARAGATIDVLVCSPSIESVSSVLLTSNSPPRSSTANEVVTSAGLTVEALRNGLLLPIRDTLVVLVRSSLSSPSLHSSLDALAGLPYGHSGASGESVPKAISHSLYFAFDNGFEIPAPQSAAALPPFFSGLVAVTHDPTNHSLWGCKGNQIVQLSFEAPSFGAIPAGLATRVTVPDSAPLLTWVLFDNNFLAANPVSIESLAVLLRSAPEQPDHLLPLLALIETIFNMTPTPAPHPPTVTSLLTSLSAITNNPSQLHAVRIAAASALGAGVLLAHPDKSELCVYLTPLILSPDINVHLSRDAVLQSLVKAAPFSSVDAAHPAMLSLWEALLRFVQTELVAAVTMYPLCTLSAHETPATTLLVQLFEQVFIHLPVRDSIPFLTAALDAVSTLCDSLSERLMQLTDKDVHAMRTSLTDLLNSAFVTLVVLPWISVFRTQALAAAAAPSTLLPTARLTGVLGRLFHLSSAMRLDSTDKRNFSIPRISSPSRKLETVHPVHDNYHFLETCTLAGAKQLYLTFDRRCSSQYDYDRVVVHAGVTTAAKKVAEFGGNTAGFGSRSVYGQGWPRRPLRVPGDSVTLEFQMRSSRESSTPDHAMWGVAVTVRDDVDGHGAMDAFSPVLDLTFSLLHLILEPVPAPIRPSPTLATLPLIDEFLTQHATPELLQTLGKESLLTRADLLAAPLTTSISPRSILLRPTLQRILDPPTLEAEIGACALAVLGYPADLLTNPPPAPPPDQVTFFDTPQLSPTVSTRLSRGFERFLRWLMSIADLEKKWNDEATEIAAGRPMDTHFFSSWHVDPIHARDLRVLCELMGVALNPGHELEAVSDLTTHLNQFARAKAAEVSPSAAPSSAINVASTVSGSTGVSAAPAPTTSDSAPAPAVPVPAPTAPAPAAAAAPTAPLASDSTAAAVAPGTPAPAKGVEIQLDLTITKRIRNSAIEFSRLLRLVRTKRVPVFDDEACKLLDALFTVLTDGLLSNTNLCADIGALIQSRWAFYSHAEKALQSALQCLQLMNSTGVCAPLALFVVELAVKLLCIDLQHLPQSLESHFLGIYGACFSALVKTVEADPEALICGIAVAFSPFVSAQAVCLCDSGLVNLLEKMCRSTTASVRGTAWRAFRALTLRCSNWDTATAVSPALESMKQLSVQLSQVLEQRLSTAVQTCCGPRTATEHYAAVVESLLLFDALSESVLGMSVVTNPKSVENFMRLLMQDTCPPKILTPLVKLLTRALPLMDTHVAPEHAAVFQETTKPTLIGMLMNKLASLLVPRGPCSRLPSILTAATGVPFAQSLHAHNLTLSLQEYAKDGWRCDVCKENHTGQSFHCSVCEFDLCINCYHTHVVGKGSSQPTASTRPSLSAALSSSSSSGPAAALAAPSTSTGAEANATASGSQEAGPVASKGDEDRASAGANVGDGSEFDDSDEMHVVRLIRRDGESVGDVIKPVLSLLQSIDDCEVEGEEDGSNIINRVEYELNKQNTSVIYRGTKLECEDFIEDCAHSGAVTSMHLDEESHSSDQVDDKAKPVFKSPEDGVCRTWNEKFVADRAPELFFLKANVAAQMATRLVGLLQGLLQRGPVGWIMAMEEHLSTLLATIPTVLASAPPPPSPTLAPATPDADATPTTSPGPGTPTAPTSPPSTSSSLSLAAAALGLAALAVLHHREGVSLGQSVTLSPQCSTIAPAYSQTNEETLDLRLTPTATTAARVRAWHVPLGQLDVALDGLGIATQCPLSSVQAAAATAITTPPTALVPGLFASVEAALTHLCGSGSVSKAAASDGRCLLARLSAQVCAVAAALLPHLDPGTHKEALTRCLASIQTLLQATRPLSASHSVYESELLNSRRQLTDQPCPTQPAQSSDASTPVSLVLDSRHSNITLRGVLFTNDFTSVTYFSNKAARDAAFGAVVYSKDPLPSSGTFYFEITLERLAGVLPPHDDSPLYLHPSHPHALRLVDGAAGSFDCEARRQQPHVGGCGKSGCTEARRFVCARDCSVSFCSDCVQKAMASETLFVFGFGPKPDARKEFAWPARTLVATSSSVTTIGGSSPKISLAEPLLSRPGETLGVFWAPSHRSVMLVRGARKELVPLASLSGQYLLFNMRYPGTIVSVNNGTAPFVYEKQVPGLKDALIARIEAIPSDQRPPSPPGDSQSNLSAFEELPFADDFDGVEAAAAVSTGSSGASKAHDADQEDGEQDGDGEELAAEEDPAMKLVSSLPSACDSPAVAQLETPSGLAQLFGPSAVASLDDAAGEEEDLPGKLIKAWEAHVFPKIQSRFRNTAERKSGLEQIRGALLLGMHEIARLTVEGLYEDQGGVPVDIHFPTIDEVKAAPKIAVAQLQRGMVVRINVPAGREGFEVPAMEGARGMVGTVLNVESAKSLALVFVYVEEESVFRQWWFPIAVLEKIGAAAALVSPSAERVEVLQANCLASERTYARSLCDTLCLALQQRLCVKGDLASLQLEARTLFRTPINQYSALAYLEGMSFFASSGHYNVLVERVKATLFDVANKPAEGTIEKFMSGLLESLSYTDIIIRGGKNVEQIVAPDRSWTLVSCRHNGSQPITRSLGGTKASPFLSLSLGAGSTQQLYGSFPTVSITTTAALPTLLAPTNRIALKMIGKEASPNAAVLVHSLPTDFAIFLALVDVILEDSSAIEEAAARAELVVAAAGEIAPSVVRALSEGNLSLAMRETLLHVLAALIRKFPSKLSALFMELSTLCDLEQGNVVECFKSLKLALPSSYAQAVLEVLVACKDSQLALPLLYMHEDTGDGIHETLSALYSVVSNLRSIAIQSVLPTPEPVPTTPSSAAAAASASPSASSAFSAEAPGAVSKFVESGLSSAFEVLMRAEMLKPFFVVSPSAELASDAAIDALSSIMVKFGGVRREIQVYRPETNAEVGVTKISIAVFLNSASRRADVFAAITNHSAFSSAVITPGEKLFFSPDASEASHVAAARLFVLSIFAERKVFEPTLYEILLPGLSTQPHASRAHTMDEIRRRVDLAAISKDDTIGTACVFFKESPVPPETIALPVEQLLPALVADLVRLATEQPIAFVRSLLMYGYDLSLHQTRPRTLETATQAMAVWGTGMSDAKHPTPAPEILRRHAFLADQELVQLANVRARALGTHAMRLPPPELVFSEVEAVSANYRHLATASLGAIRIRFALLQALNEAAAKGLSVVDLHHVTLPGSIAALIAETRSLLFYDMKVDWFNRVLDDTAQRVEGGQVPEISFDPLQALSRVPGTQQAHFYTVLQQISQLDVTQLRTRMPAGGDPVFPMVVRMTGESVRGNSGSFRDLLLNLTRSFAGPESGLFMECPSAGLGSNHGRLTINPAPLTPASETLFEFLGVFMGIAIRADVPLPLDLLPHFWKGIVGLPVTADDLPACDRASADLLQTLAAIQTADELHTFTHEHDLSQMVQTMDGRTVNLLPHLPLLVRTISAPFTPGGNTAVPLPGIPFAELPGFIRNLRALRLRELQCRDAVAAIRRGLGAVVPLDTLAVMGWQDLELRACGLPEIDLAFLRQHTHYQVGLSETDQHIRFFWRVLEGLQPEELRMFVKFACNLERLPTTCTCKKTGGGAHVPPYPMTLAPPDGSGPADKRFIRAETCMFMVKLPQYSTLELMRERLLHAIHCRDDPLSG
eukprot:m.58943 g.58943  ORF g.58943 m.58943 type:complete len:4152 (-) comp12215_c0_seq1:28-12483(-)